MRLLSSSILLSIAVLAASCSKSQYAQVEPDDLYFTKKDRQEAVEAAMQPTSPAVALGQPTEVPSDYQRSDYSDQHAPVFTSPTYANPAYGSPTIQAYGQQPYYDTSVNPDYAYEDAYANTEGGNTEYYSEDYAYQAPPVYETPQVNNYYYGMPASYYPATASMMGINVFSSYYRPFGRPAYYWGDPFFDPWTGYNPYAWNSAFYYNPLADPFNRCFGYFGYYGIYSSPYNYNVHYGNNFYDNDGNFTYIVKQPRQSRSQVSYEVDKSNLPIKSRRADYVPSSREESGRVATTNTATRSSGERSSYTRRGSSSTYYTGTDQRASRTSSTVQTSRRNSQQRNRTVVSPTRTQTRTNYAKRGNNSQNRNTRAYNANRSSVNRSGATNRSAAPSRYSTRSTNSSRISYGTRSSSGSRSNTSFRPGSSAGRSSSRSFSVPGGGSRSRSSGSISPSRSSSRSSGSRSSGSSSSGRSSGRRN